VIHHHFAELRAKPYSVGCGKPVKGTRDFPFVLSNRNGRIGAKKGRPRDGVARWGAVGHTMKYVCRLHPDVVLFEEPDPPKETIVERILGNISDLAFGRSILFDASPDKPRQCREDGHWYYKDQCKQVP
jgi:hypothetical protein